MSCKVPVGSLPDARLMLGKSFLRLLAIEHELRGSFFNAGKLRRKPLLQVANEFIHGLASSGFQHRVELFGHPSHDRFRLAV